MTQVHPHTRGDEDGWHAFVPSLPGCHTCGDTIAEALAHAREAVQVYIEDMKAEGEPIPEEHYPITWVEADVQAGAKLLPSAPSAARQGQTPAQRKRERRRSCACQLPTGSLPPSASALPRRGSSHLQPSLPRPGSGSSASSAAAATACG
ncbi:MAG: type II toxin-antitoxin system HicB family antitoxin [Armatimonadota bacterium]